MPLVLVVGAGRTPGLGLYEASEAEFDALFAGRPLAFAEDRPAEGHLSSLGLWDRPVPAGEAPRVDGVLLHGFADRRAAVEAMWREGSPGAPAWAGPPVGQEAGQGSRQEAPAGRRSLIPVLAIWVAVLAVAVWWYTHRG